MRADDEIFALSPHPIMRVEMLGGKVPVLLVDHVFANPDEVRAHGLALPFAPPSLHYPGRIASPPEGNASLDRFRSWVLDLVNTAYLSLAPLSFEGRAVAGFRDVQTDFAVVDVHPDDLHPAQRQPHVDPVPLFGLVYLNREERGGTLFFERTREAEDDSSGGYFTEGSRAFRLLGRIAPAFNRLAIYPGSVPHSGEIVGDWIRSEARIRHARLTQRLMFVPA